MNRTQQLKLLNNEIHRLFSEGVDEKTAFEQLQADERFDSVRRSSIQSLYKKLQRDFDKEASKEIKQNQLEESKRLEQYRQNAEELLLYDGLAFDEYLPFGRFWDGRYFMFSKKYQSIRGMQTINVYDIYQGMSKEISFSIAGDSYKFQTLSEQFLLFVELNAEQEFIHLAQVDLIEGTLQIIQTIERMDPSFITNSSDPSQFLLNFCLDDDTEAIEVCKLSNGTIEIERRLEFGRWGSIYGATTYFNGKLFLFQFDNDMSDAKILVQDLDSEKKYNALTLKQFPSNVCIYYNFLTHYPFCKWACDRLFIAIKFRSTKEFGIVFTDPQTCAWTIIDFAVNLTVQGIFFANNRDLLISTETQYVRANTNSLSKTLQIYKLPMRMPESLRNKAWTKTVMLFKKRQVDDPYEQARQCLPLNSDIRGFFNVESNDDKQAML